MTPININRHRLSRLVWDSLLDHASHYDTHKTFLRDTMIRHEDLREHADYNTGSIPFSSAWCNFAITNYFNPDVIAEVGTFIGKSTMSLAYGMFRASQRDVVTTQKVIYTCDMSNDIDIGNKAWQVHIEQYKKKSSVEMFSDMNTKNVHADMVNIDGRLGASDFEVLFNVITERTIFLLDDFEGTEKGVANAFNLLQYQNLRTYTLIYPPERDILTKHGLVEPCFTAMLVPLSIIQFNNQ